MKTFKKVLFTIYAMTILVLCYIPMILEEQIRELVRAFRNWKPANSFRTSNAKYKAWFKANWMV